MRGFADLVDSEKMSPTHVSFRLTHFLALTCIETYTEALMNLCVPLTLILELSPARKDGGLIRKLDSTRRERERERERERGVAMESEV